MNLRFAMRAVLSHPVVLSHALKGRRAMSNYYWELERAKWLRFISSFPDHAVYTHGFWMYADPPDFVYSSLCEGEPHEPNTSRLLRRITENAFFVDIGANIGWYSLLCAKRAKRIVAVEPESRNFEYLLRSIEKNGFKNVEALQMCIGANDGWTDLYLSTEHSGLHSTKVKVGENSICTECKTLDSLFPHEFIDVLKIDVEGGEPEVLEGAQRILRERRVGKIVMEWTPEVWEGRRALISEFKVSKIPESYPRTNVFLTWKSQNQQYGLPLAKDSKKEIW